MSQVESEVLIVVLGDDVASGGDLAQRAAELNAQISSADEALQRYQTDRKAIAVMILRAANVASVRTFLSMLHDTDQMQRLRVLLWADDPLIVRLAQDDSYDVQAVIPLWANVADMRRAVHLALQASRALISSFPIKEFYLDNSFHDVIEWFEKTRWEWSDLPDMKSIDRDLLSPQDILVLKEGAIIEFGTLPGADNFLREFNDEFGFSSWALQWGGEEARHSLIQARYLKEIGYKIRSSHAMFKRQPYPMGSSRAATLMMNIISEYRAAHYYSQHSNRTNEPVLKAIWRLLSKDEARHAKAFSTFCQELCDLSESESVEALKMAYVWLADRSNGVKHPAGHFYKHSTSETGLRAIEAQIDSATDHADTNVFHTIQRITGDASITDTVSLKRAIRARL